MSGRYAVVEFDWNDGTVLEDGRAGQLTVDHPDRVTGVTGDPVNDDPVPFATLVQTHVESPVERDIADGFMSCVARWGVGKTTVEDIAREAGVSRATVYRHFPGGKNAIAATAWSLDVSEFISAVTERILDARDLEDALVLGMTTVAEHFGRHPALNFMRVHEPAEFERLVSFERMDTILLASGTSMAPLLERFLDSTRAFDASLWIARILVSYLSEPARYVDLGTERDVRRFVRTFVLPGVMTMNKISQPKTSTHGDPKNLGDQNVHC